MKLNRRMGQVATLAVIALVMGVGVHADTMFRPGAPWGTSTGHGVCPYGTHGFGSCQSVTTRWRMAMPLARIAAPDLVAEDWPPNTRFRPRANIVAPATVPSMPMQISSSPVPVLGAYRAVPRPWPDRYVQVGPRPSSHPVVFTPQPSGPRPLGLPMGHTDVQARRTLG